MLDDDGWENEIINSIIFHIFSCPIILARSLSGQITFHLAIFLRLTEGQHGVDHAGGERRAPLRRWLAKGCQLSGS